MEVSYIIRQNNKFEKDKTIYPIYEFDYSIPVSGKLETNLNNELLLKIFWCAVIRIIFSKII